MESRKTSPMNLFTEQQWRHRHMDMAAVGEGVGGRSGNMEIYTTICKIDSQWQFAV